MYGTDAYLERIRLGIDMKNQSKYEAAKFLSIWQANFIGLVFASSLMTSAKDAAATVAAMSFGMWSGSMHWIWSRVRRVFWPEDFT